MSVTAEGFTPGETIIVMVDSKGTRQRLVADANGRVRFSVKVTSESQSRSVTVQAIGSTAKVTQQFEITGSSSDLPVSGSSVAATVFFAFSALFVGHIMLWRRRAHSRFPVREMG